MSRRPTLYDVASEAGVSLATASRVVNGSERGVGEALRAQVMRVAAELGYVPHGPAQALARASSATVGVIVHDIADPYFTEIALGAMAVADDGSRLVTLCNSFGDPLREQRYVALLHAQRVSALVLVGAGHVDARLDAALARQVRSFQEGGGQVAVVGRHAIEADAVLPDNRGGAERLGRALLELGHTRIGIISGPAGRTTTEDRLDGLLAVLSGVAVAEGDFSRDGGARGMGVLLDRHHDLSAVVAPSDQAAIGARAVLRSRGVQAALFGFDDIPAARDFALSTVRLPLRELGAAAMRLALDGWTGPPRTIVLATELVLRD